MAILVTGGAGFIGSHVVDELLAQGQEVVCVDNLNEYYDPKIKMRNIAQHMDNPRFHVHIVDIQDKEALAGVFEEHAVEKVLHLAARAGVRPSLKQPRRYVDANLVGTANVLDLCVQHNVRHVVAASSSSVYGKNTSGAFREMDNTDFPLSPYASTKKGMEALCHAYSRVKDLDVTCLRFFTVYGPRNRPDMAMFTFSRAIRDAEEIKVYGENTQRDWTYIADIVDGILRAMDTPFRYEIINLGNSHPVPVEYVIQLLEKEFGKSAITARAPLPVGDVPITFADTTKAKELLRWQPTTAIEDGVKKFAEWFKAP